MVVAVKQLADELGQTPTLSQFKKHVRSGQWSIENSSFRTYSALIESAGLVPARVQRITNKIFEKDINSHLDSYSPGEAPERTEPWPKIAILGDMHEPFASDRIKADFVSFCGTFQPDYIVQVGDCMDMYSHSRFPKSHNVFTPQDEETRARKNLEEFWSILNKTAPQAKKVQLLGNHDVRPIKGVLTHMPSMEHWAQKYLKDLLTFDNVETVMDPRQEYFISDIAFLHGHLGKLGDHRDYMLMNAVRGHDHTGGVVFRKIHNKTLWELDAGFAGDIQSKGFTYTSQKMTKNTEGFAAIDSYGPRFIPR